MSMTQTKKNKKQRATVTYSSRNRPSSQPLQRDPRHHHRNTGRPPSQDEPEEQEAGVGDQHRPPPQPDAQGRPGDDAHPKHDVGKRRGGVELLHPLLAKLQPHGMPQDGDRVEHGHADAAHDGQGEEYHEPASERPVQRVSRRRACYREAERAAVGRNQKQAAGLLCRLRGGVISVHLGHCCRGMKKREEKKRGFVLFVVVFSRLSDG